MDMPVYMSDVIKLEHNKRTHQIENYSRVWDEYVTIFKRKQRNDHLGKV